MQQTSLNLIAIGVFAITLSSLLMPLFNISPAIPALAVFGILSIATLDTLSWRGKGVNLLLDMFARFSPEYRDRIIKHEAGHFLVAYLLGIPITGYTLSAWEAFKQGQSGQGGVSFAPQEFTSPLAAIIIQRYCTVWMAGIAAENIVYGTSEGGAEDRQKLQEVLSAMGRSVNECLQQERFCILQAKTLIQEHLTAYESIVAAMQQRKSVEECLTLINEQLSINNQQSPITN
ncbi:MAG TPA: ATP-dependent Zn protease [Oculatellaceae cyanobacterium]|jgi:hypothetical protein